MSQFQTQLKDALPQLWRYAYSLTRDRYRADDLVQDCIERALRKQSHWDRSKPLKPWLMTILLNLFRDRYRSRISEVAFVEDYVGGAEDRRWEDRAKLRDVASRMQALPEGQRQALLLVAIAGLSYAEVAEILDVPIGTVLSRVARARRSLSETKSQRKPDLRSVK